jgi:hypothetical protein
VTDPVLLLCPRDAFPRGAVWGSDDGVRPDCVDALDWLTLCRLIGWSVEVRAAALLKSTDLIGRQVVIQLAGDLQPPAFDPEQQVLVVRPARGTPLDGRFLAWTGPGPAQVWTLAAALPAHALAARPEDEVWATLDGAPTIIARRHGRRIDALVGLDASAARRVVGAASAVLKRLLAFGAPAPVAWLDFKGALVLRMDDPGASANVHLRPWSYAKLREGQWREIARDLSLRGGRMTIGYTPGWVDDGDPSRGDLVVAGQVVDRVPGEIHPSPLVRYVDRAGNAPGTINDHESEFRGIQAFRAAGVGDVELHGHTHLYPDAASWACASDRYVEVGWYRELGFEAAAALAARPAGQHPLALGVASLRHHFAITPTTLICPGHAWTPATLERALALDFELVATDGLAVRDRGRFCWCCGVSTSYLDAPAASHFDAELPVVAYFHDREPAVFGTSWVRDRIDEWRAAGARRLIDLRELAAALALHPRLEWSSGAWQLRVERRRPVGLPRPLELMLRFPGTPPDELAAVMPGSISRLRVQSLGGGLARTVLPADVRAGYVSPPPPDLVETAEGALAKSRRVDGGVPVR